VLFISYHIVCGGGGGDGRAVWHGMARGGGGGGSPSVLAEMRWLCGMLEPPNVLLLGAFIMSMPYTLKESQRTTTMDKSREQCPLAGIIPPLLRCSS
jgi:hypothetical protein